MWNEVCIKVFFHQKSHSKASENFPRNSKFSSSNRNFDIVAKKTTVVCYYFRDKEKSEMFWNTSSESGDYGHNFTSHTNIESNDLGNVFPIRIGALYLFYEANSFAEDIISMYLMTASSILAEYIENLESTIHQSMYTRNFDVFKWDTADVNCVPQRIL